MRLAMNGLRKILFVAFSLQIFHALPAIAQVQIVPTNDGTGTVVLPNGNQIDIRGGTTSIDGANLFHRFQIFDVNTGQTINFVAAPQVQNILNGVTGGSPSVINGTLQITGGSNANLYLLNPAGIVFGPNAQLNINGSFTATTARTAWFGDRNLDIFNPSYSNLSGNLTGLEFDPKNPAAIVNAGNLNVGEGKSVTLTASTVVNTGNITAPNGSVNIVAVPDGRLRMNIGVEGLNFEFPQPKDTQGNALPFKALDLPSLLTTGKLDSNTGISLNSQGQAQLTNSQTVIPNTAGTAIVSGNVSVTSPVPNPSQLPPKIQILGDRVGLVGANLNASGVNGGGSVFIGGDFQGKGVIPNALMTFVSADSTIKADALQSGNGGRVIVWADNATRFFGSISARGGAISGDGGFVEVSGKQNLVFDGKVDLNAAMGKGGTLLLDPTDVTICNNASCTFTQAFLEGINGNTNILIDATNNITIGTLNIVEVENNQFFPALTFQQGTGIIEFTAGGTFSMPSNSFLQARGRDITITAGEIDIGTILVRTFGTEGNAGSVNLTTTIGDIKIFLIDVVSLGSPGGNAGNITIDSAGRFTTQAHLRAFSQAGNAGNVSVKANGNILFACPLSNACGIEAFIGDSSTPSPVKLDSGDINVTSTNGSITFLNTASLSSYNNNDGKAGNITVSAKGDINVSAPIASLLGFNNGRKAGDINITSTDGKINLFNIDSSSASGIGGDIVLSAPSGINVGNITTGGSVIDSTGGKITFDGKIELSQNSTLNTGTLSSGDITFGGTVDGSYALNIIANTGTVNFQGNVGSTNPLTGLTITAQNTKINGNISTDNSDITFSGLLTPTATSILNAGTGTIALNGGLNAGSNAISLIADQISLTAPFSGTGTLTLKPSSAGRNIVLGGTDLTAFNLTSATLSAITGVKLSIGSSSVGSISVTAPITFNTSATLIATAINLNSDLTTQALTLTGNTQLNTNIAITSNNSDISTNGTVNSLTGNNFGLTINAGTGNINLNGAVGATNRLSTINLSASNISISGGLNTINSLQISNPITVIGTSTLSALNGDINISAPINVQAGTAANLTIHAATGNVTTQDINLASAVGAGNSLTLLAPQGIVNTGNLNVNGTSGGNIDIQARTSITTGTLSAVGLSGNGGRIVLDPLFDIFTGAIDAQGFGGVGGTVDLTSNQFVRIFGTFIDQNGLVASISTAGTAGDGFIIIRHDGGTRFEPFNVFSSLINGTDGVLTTGAGNTIFTPRSFPGPYTQGNIQIITAPNFTIFLATQPLKEPPRVQWVDEGDRAPFPPEEFYTREFETFFKESIPDLKPVKIMTLTEIQETLRRVQSGVGVKPALLYVTFMPDRMNERKSDRISENECLTPLENPNASSPKLFDLNITQRPDDCDILELTLVTANGKPTYIRVKDKGKYVRREQFQKLATTLRSEVTREPDINDPMSYTEYSSYARNLYDLTISQLKAKLEEQGVDNLTFILPTKMRGTPFAALKDQQNKHIIQTYSVGLMPSLSLTDTTRTKITDRNLLFLGASEFTNEYKDRPLKYVRSERENVINVWGGNRSESYLNSEFTLGRLENPNNAGILHLSTHAIFNEQNSGGAIYLSQPNVSLNDVRQYNWKNVSLLILSACQTAEGSEKAELGFAGAANRINVKSVIATLWAIQDKGTPLFMKGLYEEFKDNPRTIGEAFRKSQVRLLENKDTRHPYYWTGFTLVGNPW
jgi:filamentous hemagglutinin family protein